MSTERDWSKHVLAAEVEGSRAREVAGGGQGPVSGEEQLAPRGAAAGSAAQAGASFEDSEEPLSFEVASV